MPSEPFKTYAETRHCTSWIIYSGLLVRVGSIIQRANEPKSIGIIISRAKAGFGIYGDKWNVLVGGRIITLEDSSVWPLEHIDEL